MVFQKMSCQDIDDSLILLDTFKAIYPFSFPRTSFRADISVEVVIICNTKMILKILPVSCFFLQD